MGFLDAYEGTRRIDFDGGYWIDVKRCLSSAEYRKVQAYLGAGRRTLSVNQAGGTTTQIDPAAAQDELLFLSIQDWNLDDAEGSKLPLSPDAAKRASISRLPNPVFMQLHQLLDELNGPRKGKDAAQFPESPVSGDPDGDDASAGA